MVKGMKDVHMPEEFNLSLGKGFMRSIAEKAVNRIICRALGAALNVKIGNLQAWSDDCRDIFVVDATVRCEIPKSELIKLLKIEKEIENE